MSHRGALQQALEVVAKARAVQRGGWPAGRLDRGLDGPTRRGQSIKPPDGLHPQYPRTMRACACGHLGVSRGTRRRPDTGRTRAGRVSRTAGARWRACRCPGGFDSQQRRSRSVSVSLLPPKRGGVRHAIRHTVVTHSLACFTRISRLVSIGDPERGPRSGRGPCRARGRLSTRLVDPAAPNALLVITTHLHARGPRRLLSTFPLPSWALFRH